MAYPGRRVRSALEVHAFDEQIGCEQQVIFRTARAEDGAIIADAQNDARAARDRDAPTQLFENVLFSQLSQVRIRANGLPKAPHTPKTVRSGLTLIGASETIQVHFQMVVRIGSSGTNGYEDFAS